MAVREGFEPSMQFLTTYSLSRGAPSASRPSHRRRFVGGIILFSENKSNDFLQNFVIRHSFVGIMCNLTQFHLITF